MITYKDLWQILLQSPILLKETLGMINWQKQTCKAVSKSDGEQSPEKLLMYAPRFTPTSALLPASMSIKTDGL